MVLDLMEGVAPIVAPKRSNKEAIAAVEKWLIEGRAVSGRMERCFDIFPGIGRKHVPEKAKELYEMIMDEVPANNESSKVFFEFIFDFFCEWMSQEMLKNHPRKPVLASGVSGSEAARWASFETALKKGSTPRLLTFLATTWREL